MSNQQMSGVDPLKLFLRLDTDIHAVATRIGAAVTGVPTETLSAGFVVKVERMKMYMDIPCELEQSAGSSCDVLVPAGLAGVYTDQLVEAITEKLSLGNGEILWAASSSEDAVVAIAKLRGDLQPQQIPQSPKLA